MCIRDRNYPIDLMLPPIIAALLAGNTVVVKPSEVAAATGVKLEELINLSLIHI